MTPDYVRRRLDAGEYRDVHGRAVEITGPDQRGECLHVTNVDDLWTYWRCGATGTRPCRGLPTPPPAPNDDPSPF